MTGVIIGAAFKALWILGSFYLVRRADRLDGELPGIPSLDRSMRRQS